MLKAIGLLILIFGGVLLATFELADYFLREKEFRGFWLKIWLGIGGLISLFLWAVLIFGKNN